MTSVAFVTGASRGIGRLIATALSADGAAVAGFARGGDDLESLSSEAVLPVAVDVTDPIAIETGFAFAVARLGRRHCS